MRAVPRSLTAGLFLMRAALVFGESISCRHNTGEYPPTAITQPRLAAMMCAASFVIPFILFFFPQPRRMKELTKSDFS
jgi:hypothetical protein